MINNKNPNFFTENSKKFQTLSYSHHPSGDRGRDLREEVESGSRNGRETKKEKDWEIDKERQKEVAMKALNGFGEARGSCPQRRMLFSFPSSSSGFNSYSSWGVVPNYPHWIHHSRPNALFPNHTWIWPKNSSLSSFQWREWVVF